MVRGNKRRGGSAKNRVMNVRVADPTAGTDGLHVDRMISSIKASESQTRILIGDSLDLNTIASSETSSSYGFDQLFVTDDFASMAQQFNLFRVAAMKFEIFDLNPSVPVFNTFGIFHDNYETGVPAYTRANITDLPDSRVISAGTGQTTLYWVAHGPAETQFQQASSVIGSIAQRYGGLKYYVGPFVSANTKYSVIVHAVIDFRGRR